MLTRIVCNNEHLRRFVASLGLPLSKPQLRHVTNVADGLLVVDGDHTLAEIRRQFVDYVDPSNIADTFRIAPWSDQDVVGPLRAGVARLAVDLLAGQDKPILLVNIDDSLAIKDPDTEHLQGVDYHYDHCAKRRKRQRLQNGLSYVICDLVVGGTKADTREFTFALCPYLREKTVRRLNRHREPGSRLHYVSKFRIARRILVQLRRLLPRWVRVYVQFDSWYASKRLLKYIWRQGWHTICRVRSNRNFHNRQSFKKRFQAQRHRRYVYFTRTAADGQSTTFLLRQEIGRLRDLPFNVRALESRRHYGDKRPAYFISTDLELSPAQVMRSYAKRWGCEVDNRYLKQSLGLGDFRLHAYEAICKYLAVVQLAWVYVQTRVHRSGSTCRTPGHVIRQHRDEHAQEWLKEACAYALSCGQIEPVLMRFLPQAAGP